MDFYETFFIPAFQRLAFVLSFSLFFSLKELYMIMKRYNFFDVPKTLSAASTLLTPYSYFFYHVALLRRSHISIVYVFITLYSIDRIRAFVLDAGNGAHFYGFYFECNMSNKILHLTGHVFYFPLAPNSRLYWAGLFCIIYFSDAISTR